jgi:hypothetical protein
MYMVFNVIWILALYTLDKFKHTNKGVFIQFHKGKNSW